MKTLYESILSSTTSGAAKVKESFEKYNLDPSKVRYNRNGTIDYDGNVDFKKMGLKVLPFHFNKVHGYFDCLDNELTTLEGAPKYVETYFDCSKNNLISLEGAPQTVNKSFFCIVNQITSLKGGPKFVNGNFACEYNKLKSMRYAPKIINGDLQCSHNELTSLKGCPAVVMSFDCSNNELASLEGMPKKVNGDFYAYRNKRRFIAKEARYYSDITGNIDV